MPRKPDESDREANWHLDFRDVASLPEDRVVRIRFLVNTCAAAVTLGLLILVGWQLLLRSAAVAQIRFWDEKIATHQRENDELQLVLRDYKAEAEKINRAYEDIYSPFVSSDFVLAIGQTLPDRMTVDMIGYADGAIAIRGSLAEPPEQASRVLGHYVETLRNDQRIGALFGDISAPSLDRGKEDNLFNFQIALKPR